MWLNDRFRWRRTWSHGVSSFFEEEDKIQNHVEYSEYEHYETKCLEHCFRQDFRLTYCCNFEPRRVSCFEAAELVVVITDGWSDDEHDSSYEIAEEIDPDEETTLEINGSHCILKRWPTLAIPMADRSQTNKEAIEQETNNSPKRENMRPMTAGRRVGHPSVKAMQKRTITPHSWKRS